MKNTFYGLGLFCLLQSVTVFGWNALGHRLIAQIAYDHMTPHAIEVFNPYNRAMDNVYRPQSFINAAVWLDTLRYQEINWFASMHYIDVPFSDDGSQLPPRQEINAVWAIENAIHLLSNKYATNFDKGMALRVILHVVGDLHQPLHAATRVSTQFPKGDRGGNLLSLGRNPVAKNLHSYWDKGAGLLITKRRLNPAQISKRAFNIEHRWPCQMNAVDLNPTHWTDESHALAVNSAYKALPKDNRPDKKYQQLVKKLADQRIALAGCRLAALLNRISETGMQKMLNK